MLANIPNVNAPETETLGFNHLIDGYRQFAGPAGLSGKQVVSSEAGAVALGVFQQTIPELLWDLKRSIVGGVNAFVLHGMPFSGYYPNTTWPTYTTFAYLFSEMHNRHQPGWEYYQEFMNYTARVQHVMQSGVAKVDLAFWLKSTDYEAVTRQYWPTDLEEAGYTYEYLSPDDFSLPQAYVEDGLLAPTQQGFQALVIRGNDTLTTFGVSKLSQWANQGLPIIFSGGTPSNVSGMVSQSQRQAINDTLTTLMKLPNVHAVPFEDLASSLASLNISPRLSIPVSSGPIWYSRWRESLSEDVVYIYNDATGNSPGSGAANKTVSFSATGRPYCYDAWTGTQTPLESFTQNGNTTQISLSLARNQTTIIAFRKNEGVGAYNNHHRVGATGSSTFSDSITLSNWTLTVESWTPNETYDIETTIKSNTTYTIDALLPWNKLTVANLTHVAGRGYYHSEFTWPPSTSSSPPTGAILTLSPIIHTAVLYINGKKTPPLDVTAPQADISEFLETGWNEVDVVVSTPLGNALIPIGEHLRTAGAPFDTSTASNLGGTTLIVERDYGLVGEVKVQGYY